MSLDLIDGDTGSLYVNFIVPRLPEIAKETAPM